jgi:hypothetical protein
MRCTGWNGPAWLPVAVVLALAPAGVAADVAVDLSGYDPGCGVSVRRDGDRLRVGWPMAGGEAGVLVLDLRDGHPLFASLGIVREGEAETPLLEGVDPATFLTVGTRVAPPGRPPAMSPFNTFFDNPARRPHRTHRSRLDLKEVRVTGAGRRATIAVGDLTIGSFSGRWEITVYPGGRLVHVEAVVRTQEDGRAIVYDAGLVGDWAGMHRLAWMDTEGRLRREAVDTSAQSRPRMARHRTIIAEGDAGSLACFPPPHQFFFPRDLTDNLGFVWSGRGHRAPEERFGLGVRQSEEGGGPFVPWSNAPPGSDQRLGTFYLLSRGPAEEALDEVLRYTRGDRFARLPGHATFTSHWHMAIAVAALKAQAEGRPPTIPDFVGMFQSMRVDIVHLAEFHGDGHPQDPGPLRLPELEALFAECRRLSGPDLLLLPGEEANLPLGVPNTGHWVYLFPRPVPWILRRAPGEPFAEPHPRLGTVYRVGGREDLLRLLEREHGLAWTSHPRIKASSWAPDNYRHEDFFRADPWLGAAWKAMPADLSRPKLGERALDLLDDLSNWGGKKHMLGEVDVFQLDHTHELFGSMNVNYLRLDRVPTFDEGWRPILDTLRGGRFFTTTGEVLIRAFTVGGREAGETLTVKDAEDRPELRLTLEWTFPLRFAEVISGDGRRVFRQRIDLAETGPFGTRTLVLTPDLRDRTWVRVEAWDVAADGAFSQQVWLEPGR